MTTELNRRGFLRAAGSGLLAFQINGMTQLLTPGQAHAQGVPFSVLSAGEVSTLEALGETLLPGAAEDGISHFVDHQLAVAPEDCLLMIRYLGIEPPYTGFYQSGLAELNRVAKSRHQQDFAALTDALRTQLVAELSRETPAGWQGFPSQLFYFALRADAVDVVYGTEQGFSRLNIPYMAHILPPERW